MNNRIVLDKAFEKRLYLKGLYTKDNKPWNKVIDYFIEDMDYIMDEYSTRNIRQESCEKEILTIEETNLDYIIITQLRKELITSRLCGSCYANFGVSTTHELKFDLTEVEICFNHSIDTYEKGVVYKLPLSEYFILNERYCRFEDESRTDLKSKLEEMKSRIPLEESIQAHISIIVSKSERIDTNKLISKGYEILERRDFISIRKYIPNINNELIDIQYLFDLGINLTNINITSTLYNENVMVVVKNTNKDNKITKITPSIDTSEKFIKIIKKYLDI